MEAPLLKKPGSIEESPLEQATRAIRLLKEGGISGAGVLDIRRGWISSLCVAARQLRFMLIYGYEVHGL